MPSELLGSLPLAMKSSVGKAGRLDDFFQRVLLEQVIGQTDVVGHPEHFVQRRPAQVRVHDHDALAVLGEHGGEVEDGGGFAFAGAGADDGDGVELVVFAREQEVGAQDAVGFRVRALRAFIDQRTDVLRDDPQHRRLRARAPRRQSSSRWCRDTR